MSTGNTTRKMRLGLAWAFHEFILLVCQPTVYAEHLRKNYPTAGERAKYLRSFVGVPILVTFVSVVLAAILCRLFEFNFSLLTTFKSVLFGISASLLFGWVASHWRDVDYALAFGMSVGVLVGFPFAVWQTIPIENRNSLHTAIADPGRTLIVGMASGLLGGLMIHTVSAFIGKTTRAIEFSVWLGLLYCASVALAIDLRLGLLGGVVVGSLFALGFTQRKPWVAGFIFGAGYGAVIGIASGALHEPPHLKWYTGGATALVFWLSYFRYLFYPLHLLWALWIFHRASSVVRHDARQIEPLWKQFPVQDETLRLRLPYTTEFLTMLGKQGRTTGREEIMWVIANRPVHKPDALDALTTLLYDDLAAQSLDDITRVPERLEWLTIFIPSGSVEDNLNFVQFGGRMETLHILKGFLQVASDCQYYYRLKSRRLRVRSKIGEIQKAVEALRQTLAYSEHPESIRFLNIANAWKDIITREAKVVTRNDDEYEDLTPNPFIFGPALKPGANFVGRGKTAHAVERSILPSDSQTIAQIAHQVERATLSHDSQTSAKTAHQTKQTLLFVGPRRTGKTSMLYHLPGLMNKRIVRVLVDLQAPKARESASSHLKYIINETASALLDYKYIDEGKLKQLNQRYENPDVPLTFSGFGEWRMGIENHLRALPTSPAVLLCIDEYEMLQVAWKDPIKRSWVEEILWEYRNLAQHSRFALMFTGAHTFQELEPLWVNYFPYVHQIRLGFLEREDVVALLRNPLPQFLVKYGEGVVEKIISETRCQPYLVQAVAYHLVNFLNDKNDLNATVDDVDRAIEKTIGKREEGEEGEVYFRLFWNDAQSEGQQILRALARGDEEIPFYPDARDWLLRNQVIEIEDDTEKFVIPMFELWVKRFVV